MHRNPEPMHFGIYLGQQLELELPYAQLATRGIRSSETVDQASDAWGPRSGFALIPLKNLVLEAPQNLFPLPLAVTSPKPSEAHLWAKFQILFSLAAACSCCSF